MFKCAKIRLSKLSLRREFKSLLQFSFACFKLLNSFSSKSDSEKLQHKVLPDNCQLRYKLRDKLCQTAAKNVTSFSI